MSDHLTIGIPKGSLEVNTRALFSHGGIGLSGPEKALWLQSTDPNLKPVLLRPQEIPIYVARGALDCGLAGMDWILENRCLAGLQLLADFRYSKHSLEPWKWVLAVPYESQWRTTQDLRESRSEGPLRVASQLRRITEDWLTARQISAVVEFSWGATEAKAPCFVDAIVECVESGASLRANHLRALDVVIESNVHLFANRQIYEARGWKRAKLEAIAHLLSQTPLV